MEKKMILVGLSSRQLIKSFMDAVLSSLDECSVDITYIDHYNYRFKTNHTETWFVCPSDPMHRLEGVMADAIFGSKFEMLLPRAKPNAVIANRDGIWLVEYICQVEREAYRHTTDMCVCDMYPPSLFITMPPRNGKSLFRHALNAVYGKSPTAQLELYAALMKGENNMTSEEVNYIRNDVINVAKLHAMMQEIKDRWRRNKLPGIKNVIYSGPCTIVLWEDGTKTVVRCNNDVLDPEKGLAMAIAKKALGTNKSGSNYYDIFKKWLPKPEPEEEKQDG